MLARNQAMKRDAAFLCGVIEGFYGRPWTVGQRRELLERMARWGLNTYFYSPKDDLYHRTRWRDRYPAEAAGELLPDEQKRGLTLQVPEVRNRVTKALFDRAKKLSPAPFFIPRSCRRSSVTPLITGSFSAGPCRRLRPRRC